MPSLFAPTAVRFEYFNGDADVLGLGTAPPRLSWQMPMAAAGFVQISYEIEIERSGAVETFAVDSAEQVLVPWPAAPLESRERVSVRVRVRDRSGSWSGWSEPVRAEAGLLDPADWTAHFVSPRGIGGLRSARSCPLRASSLCPRARCPPGSIRRRTESTSPTSTVGAYPRISSHPAGPPTTRGFATRCTTSPRSGRARTQRTRPPLLGNGWYRGRLGYLGDRAVYGDRLAFLAQLEITIASGDVHHHRHRRQLAQRRERHPRGRLLQRPDHRPAASVRRAPATHDVDVIETDHSLLVAAEGPPVRETEVLPARRVWRSPSGRTLVDFGQNAVGRVRLRVRESTAGQQVLDPPRRGT